MNDEQLIPLDDVCMYCGKDLYAVTYYGPGEVHGDVDGTWRMYHVRCDERWRNQLAFALQHEHFCHLPDCDRYPKPDPPAYGPKEAT